MGKARMMGAFAPYTPNSKMDKRYNRKAYALRKEITNATPKAGRTGGNNGKKTNLC